MFLHVRHQLTYSHARNCTLSGSRWSARPWVWSDGIQATDFVDYHDWLHDSLIGWLWPYLILLVDPYWMAASIPWILIIVYSIMDGYANTTYHVFEISVVFVYTGFPMVVFSVGHILIKHFTPLSLSQDSCFKGLLLHSNLSPSLQSPILHIGGPFSMTCE